MSTSGFWALLVCFNCLQFFFFKCITIAYSTKLKTNPKPHFNEQWALSSRPPPPPKPPSVTLSSSSSMSCVCPRGDVTSTHNHTFAQHTRTHKRSRVGQVAQKQTLSSHDVFSAPYRNSREGVLVRDGPRPATAHCHATFSEPGLATQIAKPSAK